jgi:hypothetical protein
MTAKAAPPTVPVTSPEPPYSPVPDHDPTAVVAHPHWCDPARCTATPAAAMGEAHRGTPVTITAGRALEDLTVTATLYQAHAPWLTAVLVTLDIAGLDEQWKPATLNATVTVEQAGNVARVLAELAECGAAWQARQTDDYLSALQARVRASGRTGTSSDHDDPTGGAPESSAGSHGPGVAA